jgi:D-glycero-alpha-D-manno-heptose-7-phosphate kinase
MIISQTPLRVSIIGGGTDLPEWFEHNEGCVVGSSIDKYIYVIVNNRFDDKISVGYSKQETVDSVEEIQHDLVREAAKATGMTKGFEVKTMADVPSQGSGLGSSSAVLVGLLNAFYHYQNNPKEHSHLAYQAFYIERYVLGRNAGMQDHMFSSFGGQLRLSFSNDLPYHEPVKLSDDNLFLHYTGITRNANDILKEQASSIEGKEELYKKLTKLAKEFNQEHICDVLGNGWAIKKQLADGISNTEIENMISIAESSGAMAYKILGAGGGGFLLSYVPKDLQDLFLDKMKDYKQLPFRFTNYGTRIIYNGI